MAIEQTYGDALTVTTSTGDITLDSSTGSVALILGSDDETTTFEVKGNNNTTLFSVSGGGAVAATQGISRTNRLEYYEDFLGSSGATLPGPWATQDTSVTGTPTLDYVDDGATGIFQLTHDATSEQQLLTFYWGDSLHIDPTKNPIFEARVKINFAGATFTADQRIVIGLASSRNATLDDISDHAWFRIDGADLNIDVQTDDGTTDSSEDSTIDIVDNTWTVFRIDMSNLSDIKFYIDGVETGETGPMSAAAMTTFLQPFIEIQRDLGAEAEDVQIDYIQVIVDR